MQLIHLPSALMNGLRRLLACAKKVDICLLTLAAKPLLMLYGSLITHLTPTSLVGNSGTQQRDARSKTCGVDRCLSPIHTSMISNVRPLGRGSIEVAGGPGCRSAPARQESRTLSGSPPFP